MISASQSDGFLAAHGLVGQTRLQRDVANLLRAAGPRLDNYPASRTAVMAKEAALRSSAIAAATGVGSAWETPTWPAAVRSVMLMQNQPRIKGRESAVLCRPAVPDLSSTDSS